MSFYSSIGYWFRTSQIEPKYIKNGDTAVVFIHGILSHTEEAFNLIWDNNKYFWDLIKELTPFNQCSIFAFNYGRLDPFHITEGKRLEQSLKNICLQLNGHLHNYRNVILIGHSQGGLIAKMYACEYGSKRAPHQAVLVISLHTPHRNRSMLVMKNTKNKQWILNDRFRVPHLFCASYADNIVKPDNAIDSTLDIPYISHDTSFRQLGHSHLNRAPTRELIQAISLKAYQFLSSGYSYPGIEITRYSKAKLNSITIRFSRSEKKLKSLGLKYYEVLPDLETLISTDDEIEYNFALRNPVCIVKGIKNALGDNNMEIAAVDLDSYFSSDIFNTIDLVCEESEAIYSEILFDPNDFRSDPIIKNEDFVEIFLSELRNSGHCLRKQVESENFDETLYCFRSAISKYWEIVVHKIYLEIENNRKPKIITFKRGMELAVRQIFENKKFRRYQFLYSTFKKYYSDFGWVPEIYDIDIIVSNLFRTDGEIYRLDRDISNIFSRNSFGSSTQKIT